MFLKWISGTNTYSSLVTGLNGRFGKGLSAKKNAILMQSNLAADNMSLASLSVLGVLILTVFVSLVGLGSNHTGVVMTLESSEYGRLLLFMLRMMFIVGGSTVIWRCILAMWYKPYKTCTDAELPKCTVIIPAYNEGSHVLRSIRSIARCDYPIDKLQIIAINDGSKDDTWKWIQKAAREFPNRVITIDMPQNGGKKKALHEGFQISTGDIIVTVDSDSLIEPQSLRNLVSPFYHDRNIGAVAGSVRVLNQEKGWIPKMLDVTFVYSFDFIRASQGMLGSVMCTPGALSAYRKAPLMKFADEWLDQTFMGDPATIGEDRALTNLVLREGHDVVFQSNAVVYTNVPENYKGLCKMFLRWERSNVRETLVMSEFIFKNFRRTSPNGVRINFVLSVLNMVFTPVMLVGIFIYMIRWPNLFVNQTILATLLAATMPAVFYSIRFHSNKSLWAYVYNVFWLFGLFWIMPYSIITAKNGKWLTRELTPKQKK
jgi:hyaluronan synthase